MVRKQTNKRNVYKRNVYYDVSAFESSDLPRGYYWSDGAKDMPIVTEEEALTSGVFISEGEFEWSVNNLKGGNVYKLRVFVGVWYDRGAFSVALNIDGVTESVFSDSTVTSTYTTVTYYCMMGSRAHIPLSRAIV